MRINVVFEADKFLVIVHDRASVSTLEKEILSVHSMVSGSNLNSDSLSVPCSCMNSFQEQGNHDKRLVIRNSFGSIIPQNYIIGDCFSNQEVIYCEYEYIGEHVAVIGSSKTRGVSRSGSVGISSVAPSNFQSNMDYNHKNENLFTAEYTAGVLKNTPLVDDDMGHEMENDSLSDIEYMKDFTDRQIRVETTSAISTREPSPVSIAVVASSLAMDIEQSVERLAMETLQDEKVTLQDNIETLQDEQVTMLTGQENREDEVQDERLEENMEKEEDNEPNGMDEENPVDENKDDEDDEQQEDEMDGTEVGLDNNLELENEDDTEESLLQDQVDSPPQTRLQVNLLESDNDDETQPIEILCSQAPDSDTEIIEATQTTLAPVVENESLRSTPQQKSSSRGVRKSTRKQTRQSAALSESAQTPKLATLSSLAQNFGASLTSDNHEIVNSSESSASSDDSSSSGSSDSTKEASSKPKRKRRSLLAGLAKSVGEKSKRQKNKA